MTAMIPLVPFDFEVSSSMKLMLLQGQLAETVSAAAATPAPRAPAARAAELAVALAAMKGDAYPFSHIQLF